jgi:hypothetical protein
MRFIYQITHNSYCEVLIVKAILDVNLFVDLVRPPSSPATGGEDWGEGEYAQGHFLFTPHGATKDMGSYVPGSDYPYTWLHLGS